MASTYESGKNPSSATIEHYLKGIHYPANKDDLIEQARQNEAPADVMDVLEQFDDKDYESTVDVTKKMGELS